MKKRYQYYGPQGVIMWTKWFDTNEIPTKYQNKQKTLKNEYK